MTKDEEEAEELNVFFAPVFNSSLNNQSSEL